MIVEKDYKMLEIRKGLVKPFPTDIYYVNSLGETHAGGFAEKASDYTKAKIKVRLTFKQKKRAFYLFETESVLTEAGWKSFRELSDTDLVMFFEPLVMPYGAVELQMSPCKIDSIEFTSRTRIDLVDLDTDECIIDGVDIKTT